MRQAEDWKYILGTGHWEAFRELKLDMADIHAAGQKWAAAVGGVQRPWLCWNVDHDWCLGQQKLVREVGWTPVVGFDPRVGLPPRSSTVRSVSISMNHSAYPRCGCTFHSSSSSCSATASHSGMRTRPRSCNKMRAVAERFAKFSPTAPRPRSCRTRTAGNTLARKKRRYWEVLGCSTRGSSRDQFEKGCGWWRNFWMHPSTPASQASEREAYYYDSGAGIRFWQEMPEAG